MSDGIDPKPSDQIATTIDLAFRFVADAFDGTADLEAIASGSELAFREIDLRGRVYRLTAWQAEHAAEWVARITGYSLVSGAHAGQRPSVDDYDQMHDQTALMRALSASGPSAAEALAALARKLAAADEPPARDVVADANR